MTDSKNTFSKSEIIRDWYTTVWENGDLSAIETYFPEFKTPAQDADPNLLPEFCTQASELREWIGIFHSLVHDIKIDILQTIEEGDWFSAVIKINCKQHETNEPVHVLQLVSLRFDGHVIVESYRSLDWIRFFEQLGQLPAETHALLLSGTVLR
ncbi:MAG: hypothetical protein AB8B47_05015 [Roseobacter sp.]